MTTKNAPRSVDDYWFVVVAKRNRLEDLKKAGRYGYQLRMPRKALRLAIEAHDLAVKARDIRMAGNLEGAMLDMEAHGKFHASDTASKAAGGGK